MSRGSGFFKAGKYTVLLCWGLAGISSTRAQNGFPAAAVAQNHPEPGYPDQALREGIEGEVQVEYAIKQDGSVEKARAIGQGAPLLQQALVDTVMQWRYKPQQNKSGTVSYAATRVCYEYKLPTQPGDKPSVRQVDFPENRWRKTIPPPVYPFELLKKKRGGYAMVVFTVSAGGRVRAVSVIEASHREFGLAVQAQVEQLKLLPLLDAQGHGQERGEFFRQDFSIDGKGNVPIGGLTRRLLVDPTALQPKIFGAGDADRSPVLIKTIAPTYPVALMKLAPTGEATIDFVVDDEGIPQAIHIVSAAKIEFGYAAAQAVSQWRFNAGQKGGVAVPVRMEVSFDFRMNP